MAKARIILGAMSGTSADGVDVAVCEVTGEGLGMSAKLILLTSWPFDPELRKAIGQIRSTGQTRLDTLAMVGQGITLTYAKAALTAMGKAGLEHEQITCIAAHGQTLFHDPPLTIQWFDPSLLSVLTDCIVVSDFRRADCALGGQGAPLVPFADYLLFRDRKVNRVLLNIGGIANITYLPSGGSLNDVIAFDTGPGNCISDDLMQQHFGANYDDGGKVAASGMPLVEIADRFVQQPYFQRKPPKSTDGPGMLSMFKTLTDKRDARPADLVATACLCSAQAIAQGLRLLPGKADEIVAAGGGTQNRTLMRMLCEETGLPVRLTDELGVPAQAREAMAFALLGAATLDGVPSNVPSVTGASRPAMLGSITNSLGMSRPGR